MRKRFFDDHVHTCRQRLQGKGLVSRGWRSDSDRVDDVGIEQVAEGGKQLNALDASDDVAGAVRVAVDNRH
ncbi:hypothetical protein FB467_0051 [Ornithinicoccus hortensis]|uniref:Uncharacterized protein n=1 Tax=Ornithinicoccus hortensis TaxID=82346 RepID=A0A542YLN9_9MICO|nr:hypothetical protein FB467_0051 [Ornithinicoccus hortensis]